MYKTGDRRITRVSLKFYTCESIEQVEVNLSGGVLPADNAIEKATVTETRTVTLSARCPKEESYEIPNYGIVRK